MYEPNRSGQGDLHPVLRDKTSEAYLYYANDFMEHRIFHWSSVWFQAKEAITNPSVRSVLEFGSGRGVTKALIEHFGIRHLSVDVNDDAFIPDVCCSIEEFETDERFDMVCAFEVLEHNPFEEFGFYLTKFRRYSKKYVYISLPYSGRWASFHADLNIPKLHFRKSFSIVKERLFKTKRPVDEFRKRENPYSAHWWEVGDRDIPTSTVRSVIEESGLRIMSERHNSFVPYHLFFLCECG